MGRKLLAVVTTADGTGDYLGRVSALADRLGCPWIAVYVSPAGRQASDEQKSTATVLRLVRDAGAEIVTIQEPDAAKEILRVASQRGVTDLALRSSGPYRFFGGTSQRLAARIMREAGNYEIHILAARKHSDTRGPFRSRLWMESPWWQYAAVVAVVAAITGVAVVVSPWVGAHTIALVFLLVVVFLALFVGRGPTLLAATMSALLWDYFILPPVYAFTITHFEDAMLFAMYFIVASVLGQLTTRIRAQKEEEQHREQRSTALYLITRELGVASSIDALLRSVVNHLGNATRSQVAILLPLASGSELAIHPASSLQPEVMEHSAAEMAFRTGQVCGQFTVRFAEARAFFIPLKTAAGTEGVLGIRWSDALPPDVHEESFLGAFSQQIALALDRHRLQALSEKSRLFAESEKLSKTLLNSISHEIRTPIAAIKSATNNLVELGDGNLNEAQLAMVGETLEAVDRLNRLVGNVLDITRIESGHVRPRMALCDVQDLVHVALKETKGRLEGHPVELDLEPGLPLVRMDFVLMQQVLTNLLSNAGFHTPPGTPVTVRVGTDRSELILCVSDRGPGLPNGAAARIFEKFYRGPTAPAGGTGLGLSLVKGFVEAHRGSVVAENRRDGGASFTVRLPVDKVLTPAMT